MAGGARTAGAVLLLLLVAACAMVQGELVIEDAKLKVRHRRSSASV